MIRLLKIDFRKLRSYRTFWVLNTMYYFLIASIPISIYEFLKWLKGKGVDFDEFDPTRVPISHFPDVWQNLTYIYIFLKFFLAIIVIISITNEYTYKTIRQNIIDGLDRWDFLKSKLYTIVLMSFISTVFVCLMNLITGFLYTPDIVAGDIFDGVEFIFAYFLDLVSYLIFALLIGNLVKRSGLSISLLVMAIPIEYTITGQFPEEMDFLVDYFPLHAINNLIEIPFPRYVFMEIQDYVSLTSVIIVIAYIALFIYLNYAILKSRDLQ